ncbi:MAG: hypothetical protein AAGE01_08960 [Pseudomonadota bacterium]
MAKGRWVMALGLAAATSVQAVEFAVVDTVVDVGTTELTVVVAIDPEGANVDGFQFGLISGFAATVETVQPTAHFLDVYNGGSDVNLLDVERFVPLATVVVDIDAADVNALDADWPVGVLEIDLTLPVPIAAGDVISIDFTSGLRDITVGYVQDGVFFDDVDVSSGTISVGTERAFNVGGPGDFFDGDNWTPTGVPDDRDTAVIGEDGVANAASGGTIDVHRLYAGTNDSIGGFAATGGDVIVRNDLAVASGRADDAFAAGGSISGNATIADGEALEVSSGDFGGGTSTLRVAVPSFLSAGSYEVSADGDLTVTDVENVDVGGSVEVASASPVPAVAKGIPAGISVSSTGGMSVSGSDRVRVAQDISVGEFGEGFDGLPAGSQLAADAEFTVDGVTNEFLVVGDVDMAKADACISAGAVSFAADVTSQLSNMGSLALGQDLDLAVADCQSLDAAADVTAAVTISNVGPVTIGDDIELSTGIEIRTDRTVESSGALTVQNVPSLDVGDKVRIGYLTIDGGFAGVAESDGRMTVSDVPQFSIGNVLQIGVSTTSLGQLISGDATVAGALVLDNVIGTVQERADVGRLKDCDVALQPGASVAVSGELSLTSSAMTIPEVIVGVGDEAIGTATGMLSLNPSVLDNEILELGSGGTIELSIDGPVPATAAALGTPGLHARINTTTATLNGVINVTFNSQPDEGTTSYDLIVAPAGGLAGTPTLSTSGLDGQSTIDAFEIVEAGGNEVLRLTVTRTISPRPELVFRNGFEGE